MTIIPTQAFLLIRVHNVPDQGTILTPDATKLPYGEVLAAGPKCEFCAVGDSVLFRPENYVAGFDQGQDEKFIIPEAAVFGKVSPDNAIALIV